MRIDAPAGQRTMPAGPADVDGGDEVTGDEAFRIASITKLFTATVALQLAEEGVVPLDYVGGDALFSPGTAWSYSNVGYVLAGAVVEAATGEPLVWCRPPTM